MIHLSRNEAREQEHGPTTSALAPRVGLSLHESNARHKATAASGIRLTIRADTLCAVARSEGLRPLHHTASSVRASSSLGSHPLKWRPSSLAVSVAAPSRPRKHWRLKT